MSINNPDEVLRELRRITKILTLSNSDKLKTEIERFATSDDRKKMGVLIDGNRQSGEIATTLKVTKRGVDYFLQALEQAGMIERPYNKPPRRTIDYVPADWIEMIPKSATDAEVAPKESVPPNSNSEKIKGDSNG